MSINAVQRLREGITDVTVVVATGAGSGVGVANPRLTGGQILGYYPAGNQDQFVDSIVLNANGSVTVTLAANATADNTYTVVVAEPYEN